MWIVDQGQVKASEGMAIHHERAFAPELIDEAMALRVAAGAVDLVTKRPSTVFPIRPSGLFYHLSARAGHEIHLESVHRA